MAIQCYPHIPDEYKKRVDGVSILAPNATVGDLGVKLDKQTANLDKSWNNQEGTLSIVKQCDNRNKEIIEILTPKQKKFLFW
jgi:hypothetical protein